VGFLGRKQQPLPTSWESEGALRAPQRGSGRSPDRPQFFSTIFSTQNGLSRHYNIGNCRLTCSHLGEYNPRAPLCTPLCPTQEHSKLQEIAPSFWSAPLSATFAPARALRVFGAIPNIAPFRFGHVSFCKERFFLPRDAMCKRGNSCRPVSVCLSVTLMYCIETASGSKNVFICHVVPSF